MNESIRVSHSWADEAVIISYGEYVIKGNIISVHCLDLFEPPGPMKARRWLFARVIIAEHKPGVNSLNLQQFRFDRLRNVVPACVRYITLRIVFLFSPCVSRGRVFFRGRRTSCFQEWAVEGIPKRYMESDEKNEFSFLHSAGFSEMKQVLRGRLSH